MACSVLRFAQLSKCVCCARSGASLAFCSGIRPETCSTCKKRSPDERPTSNVIADV